MEGSFKVKSHSIVVTDVDMERLSGLVRGLQHSLFRDQQQLDALNLVLQTADVRPPSRTAKSIVRMNSSIRVRDFEMHKEQQYTLVFPDEADISSGQITVLAPVGIALLGHRKGEVIEAKVPGGTRRLKIEQVRQTPGLRCEWGPFRILATTASSSSRSSRLYLIHCRPRRAWYLGSLAQLLKRNLGALPIGAREVRDALIDHRPNRLQKLDPRIRKMLFHVRRDP